MQKIVSLESIRGLAALAVVLCHCMCGFFPTLRNPAGAPGTQLWQNGEFAVRLFFVLSGFVLSLSYFRQPSLITLRSAAVRRYFRLLLPIAGSVLLGYLLAINGGLRHVEFADLMNRSATEWTRNLYTNAPSVFDANSAFDALAETTYRAFVAFDWHHSLNSVLWTMQAEFLGSMFVFATLAVVGRLRWRGIAYVGILVALIVSNACNFGDFLVGMAFPDWHPRWPAACNACYFVDFLAGLALADWHTRWPRNSSSQTPTRGAGSWAGEAFWPIVFIAALVGGDCRVEWLESVKFPTAGAKYFLTPMAAAVVAAIARSTVLDRMLSIAPLQWLGRLSFCLYLVHVAILCSVGMTVFFWTHSAIGSVAATVVVSLGVAWIGARTLDPWSIALGRFVDRRLFPGRSLASSEKAAHRPTENRATERRKAG